MAQVSFDSIANSLGNSRGEGAGTVSFFTCKENEDVVVRFLHDSTQTFDIHTVHEVMVNGKPKDYECVRDPHDPVDACPLCAVGTSKLKQKMYVHMIKYTRNEQGGIVATPCCWVRTANFALQLKEFIDNYGPLSDLLFKVKRTGQGLDTRYNIMYAPPATYPPVNYPMECASVFVGWSPVGAQIRRQGSDTASTASAAPTAVEATPVNAPQYQLTNAAAGTAQFVVNGSNDVAAAPVAPSAAAPSPAERFPAARPWNRVQNAGVVGAPGRPDRY